MRAYETMVILDPTAPGSGELVDRFVAVIEREGGTMDNRLDWGMRRMTYEVGGKTHAHYWLLEYQAGAELVKELERNMRISEGVLRYMSVQQDHTGLPEPKPERIDDRGDRGERGDRDRDRDRDRGPRRDTPLHQMRDRDEDDEGESDGTDEAPVVET